MPNIKFCERQILYFGDTVDDMKAALAASEMAHDLRNGGPTKLQFLPIGIVPPQSANEM